MRAYLLLRESVPPAQAVLAATKRKDLPKLVDWLTGSADMEYCVLDDQEFERSKTYRGAIVLSSDLREGKEVAIAFGPRGEWPEEFAQFRNYYAEWEKRKEERENITEQKWLEWDTRPIDLANFALPRLNQRKIRLFAVACCDLVAGKMLDPRSRRAVEVALRHANGTTSDEELMAACHEAYEAKMSIIPNGVRGSGVPDQSSPEYGAAALAMNAASPIDRTPTTDSPDGWLSLCAAGTTSDLLIWHTMQAANDDPFIAAKVTGLLRDICGNPFRPVVAEPKWQSSGLKSLAKAIHDLKAFERLPALADALEQLGCDEESILEHCRMPGSHVPGCWVLDLVLGSEASLGAEQGSDVLLQTIGSTHSPYLDRACRPTAAPRSVAVGGTPVRTGLHR